VAAEGLIAAHTAGIKGVLVEVNSETDFVARNEQFQGLVKMIAQVAFDVGADVDKIKAAKVGGVTVETAVADAIATIGENMTLRRAAQLEVKKGVVSSYVHNAVIEGAGKMGVVVALESAGKTDELAALGRQLAMHVAATNPQALDPAGLDPAVVKREKDVLADKYRQQGKAENVIDKIVESGLRTYYKEVCLLEQAFIHDSGKSVAQAVKEAEGKIGAPVKITGFVRYALGEGIDRQDTDFAAEVAAASGKK
jgi:elongation factor Ts